MASSQKRAAVVVKDVGGSPMYPMQGQDTGKFANKQARYRKPDAVKHLEQALYNRDLSDFTARNPGVSSAHIIKPTFRDDTANGLTKCIFAYIRLHKGQAERISTTGRPVDRRETYTDVIGRTRTIGSMTWIPGTSTRGSADISATINGVSAKIEVKIGRDRQSEAQKSYQRSVEAAGGIYYIARDFDGFVAWYNETFRRAGS